MKIIIDKPINFSFNSCLNFLDRGYDECLYTLKDGKVERLICINDNLMHLSVSSLGDQLYVEVIGSELSQSLKCQIIGYVSDWFDLGRNLSVFYNLLDQNKPTDGFSKRYYGLRLMGIVDLFEALCWCVIGQQINLTFAHKIKSRLVEKYGQSKIINQKRFYCFPTPESILNADREELVKMQFSKQKINYIYNLAQAFVSNDLNKSELLKMNKQDQMAKLLAIKGVGPWTANYVCMKSLRDMTCIAYGDTGLSAALHKLYNTEKKPNKDTIDKIFKPFAGWESYLNFYLWKSLS